jgi:drug/metabolite transporter (DMT)-like permease
LLLLLTAVIWGFAFTAQRVGMAYTGPFLFNGLRFALGAAVIASFIVLRRSRRVTILPADKGTRNKLLLRGGLIAGLLVFAGASLQQVGLVYTTAGNAGFITGLYVVFVPLIGLFIRQRPPLTVWVGALLALTGMFLLSVTGGFHISKGDMLVLACAVVWALHVLYIGSISPRVDALKLALMQYLVTTGLSLLVALFFEKIRWEAIVAAAIPLLYGGCLSVGVAYTLQVVAQKKAPPAPAAIIMSMEGVFAALGGWLLINESMSARALTGCALMLTGMILAQTRRKKVTI